MPRKKKEEVEEVVEEACVPSEKDTLLALYDELKRLNIRSISDLENLIANAE